MPYDVATTTVAAKALAGLRGPNKKRADAWHDDLRDRGCAAMHYRLTGDDPLPSLCCVHLRGKDRAVAAFQDDTAVVLLVGPHDEQDAAVNVYDALYVLVGHPTEPLAARTKPSCCDSDAHPPELSQAVVDDLVFRSRQLLRR